MIYTIKRSKFNELDKNSYNLVLSIDNDFYIDSNEKLKTPFTKTTFTRAELDTILREQKDLKIAELNLACDKRMESFTSDALGEPHNYGVTLEDQLNLLSLVVANLGSFFRCKKENETSKNVLHTKEQIQKVFKDGLIFKSQLLNACGNLKLYVETLNDINAIKALTFDNYSFEKQTIDLPVVKYPDSEDTKHLLN